MKDFLLVQAYMLLAAVAVLFHDPINYPIPSRNERRTGKRFL